MIYDYEDRPTEYLTALNEVLEISPRNKEALLHRGIAYRGIKSYEKAIADLTELIKVAPDRGAYLERARTYSRAGQYAPALADYKRASMVPEGKMKSEVRPLAWLLATCPDPKFRNGAEAVAAAEEDCKKTGCHRAVELDTLAAAYAEAGDFELAIRYQQQARDLHDEDSEWQAEVGKRLAIYKRRQPYREQLEH